MPEEIPDAEVKVISGPPVATEPGESFIVQYNPNDAQILEARAEFVALAKSLPNFNSLTPEQKQEWAESFDSTPCTVALKKLIPLRTGVEKCRQHLKAESIRVGKSIDSIAKRLTGLVEEVEDPIQAAIDVAKAVAKAKAEAKVRAEELLAQQQKEAEEAAAKALREAEAARVKLEQEAAQAKLDAERKKFEEEKAKRDAEDKARRDKIEAEDAERDARRKKEQAEDDARRKALADQEAAIKAEADRIEREKREKEIAEKAAADAKRKAEEEQAAAFRAEKLRQSEERAEADRQSAARPDVEKVNGFGMDLEMGLQTMLPEVKNPAAKEFLVGVEREIRGLVASCKAWKLPKGKK